MGGKVVEANLETLHSDVDQRFWGPLHVVRHAMRKMTSGSITFLSGQYGSRPADGAVVTAAMNAAIEVLAKGLALELAPIRVNAVVLLMTNGFITGEVLHIDGGGRLV